MILKHQLLCVIGTLLFALTSLSEAFSERIPDNNIMRKSSSRLSLTSNSSEREKEREIARRIMYHQHRKNRENLKYQIIAAEECEALARRIEDVSDIAKVSQLYFVCMIL